MTDEKSMGAFICKQPNGLYCRFSTIEDTITAYNMTEEDYINYCVERAKRDARNTLDYHLKPFEWVEEYFVENNMSRKEFNTIMKKMAT